MRNLSLVFQLTNLYFSTLTAKTQQRFPMPFSKYVTKAFVSVALRSPAPLDEVSNIEEKSNIEENPDFTCFFSD